MIPPQKFFVAGVSFKKTDVERRSKFAFAPDECCSIYSAMPSDYFQHFFILSTCNRTEIYGFAPCEYVLLSIFQRQAKTSSQEVNQHVYLKEGNEAVKHFLSVA
ncbi:MAG TPA: hypothetical protein VE467_00955, partial [Chryseolinea sp.]|nr:hypothetical protein [Chryseolinea sp.]